MAYYLFLVLAMAVSSGADDAQKQIDSLNIVANAEGVSVEALGLKAQASHVTFDNKSGRLVLDGTPDAPVLFE
jgi:predicted transcriptional regulator